MTISPLKIIYAGTPTFAAIALNHLQKSHHKVLAVFTNPDRPSGRGLKITASPVKELARTLQIPLFQPSTLKDTNQQDLIASFQADVMVVAAYGMLLPAEVLRIPRLGCINIHPSLLPRWRGAAPIQRAIHAGDTITGVSIMQMDPGLDTGPVLMQRQYVMEPDETSKTLHDKLATLGAEALITTLDLLSENKIVSSPQNNALATYANKISKEEALVDWTQPASELELEVRAFNPWPIVYTSWQNQNLRIWRAKALPFHQAIEPRVIVHASAEGIDISTGDGILRLLEVQLPGSKVLPIADFYHAKQALLKPGEKFT